MEMHGCKPFDKGRQLAQAMSETHHDVTNHIPGKKQTMALYIVSPRMEAYLIEQ
jgi:hypothetical protein